MEFRILGPLEVEAGGRAIALGGRGPRTVLAALALAEGEPVGVDHLVHALWPGRPPRTAPAVLQVHVSQIRKALAAAEAGGAARIETGRGSYALHASENELDAARFRALVESGRAALAAGNAEGASASLREALGLFRGEPLAGLDCDHWARPEIEALSSARLAALEDRIEADLQLGWDAGLYEELRALVFEHPLRERLRGQLMLALYRAGRQAEALEACREARETLVEELGVDPGPQLRALEEAILRHDPALDARGPVRLAPAGAPQGNLPAPLTTFVGREYELAVIEKALEESRLVTLTGPGGSGKTRLAVEAARGLAGRFADGAWLVELASLPHGGLVPLAVAGALGVRETPGRPLARTLAGWLAPRSAMIVLDNCEHVLDAAADLLRSLLEAGPEIRVLATSRERLGLPGESVRPVPPLPVPVADAPAEAISAADAVRLFLERAYDAAPEFTLTPSNARAVARICRRLDGLPLALELAASRLAHMSPGEIADRLDESLALLTGSRTSLPRQQTLRALIEWSWRLLDEPDRPVFEHLGILAGRFTTGAAAAACGAEGPSAILDALGRLAAKSLLVVHREEEGTSFEMLETIREYARERLRASGDERGCGARLLAHVAALAAEAEERHFGPLEQAAFARLDREQDSVRVALEWGVAHEPENAVLAASRLWRYWTLRERLGEGRRWLEAATAAAPGVDQRVRAKALGSAAVMAIAQGEFDRALPLVEESLAVRRSIGDDPGIANSLLNLGNLRQRQGKLDEAEALYRESLDRARALANRPAEARAMHNLGSLALERGDAAGAQAIQEHALEVWREIGDVPGLTMCLNSLGNIASEQGDDARARRWYEESLARARSTGNLHSIAVAFNNIGSVALRRGDWAEARAMFEESLRVKRGGGSKMGLATTLVNLSGLATEDGDIAAAEEYALEGLMIERDIGEPAGIALTLEALAHAAVRSGRHRRTVTLFAAAGAIRERMGVSTQPGVGTERRLDLAAAREAIGEEEYARAWEEGAGLTLPEAIRLASAIPGPAR